MPNFPSVDAHQHFWDPVRNDHPWLDPARPMIPFRYGDYGAMRGRPLIGFARAAERCGRIVGGDAAAFLADEQQRVFAWADKERGHVLYA